MLAALGGLGAQASDLDSMCVAVVSPDGISTTSTTDLVECCVAGAFFVVERGGLQGWPASGSLWAILFMLYDLVVSNWVVAHLEPQGSSTAFADEMAAALIDVLRGVGPVLEVFWVLRLANGLCLNLAEVSVLIWFHMSGFDLRRRLLDRGAVAAFRVCSSAKYLGIRWDPIPPQLGSSIRHHFVGQGRCSSALLVAPTVLPPP